MDIKGKNINVQIPEELAGYVMQETKYCGRYVKKRIKGNTTHHLAKAYGFYLLLKAESGNSGWIKDYTKQIPALAENFCMSQRSFFTYIRRLEELKLAFREGNKIRVVGWDQLARLLDINTKKRTTIKFEYAGKQKIHWWFAAIEIKCNQESQAYMVWKKVNKNSEIASALLAALKKRGFAESKVNNPEYYAGRLFLLYVEDFKSGTEVHDILINIRSDTNRSCKKISSSWSMSPQLTSYWKACMRKQRIIDVAKMTVMSEWTSKTKECHKNKFCHVIWDDKAKERIWFLCDQITILMPWLWQEFIALQAAA